MCKSFSILLYILCVLISLWRISDRNESYDVVQKDLESEGQYPIIAPQEQYNNFVNDSEVSNGSEDFMFEDISPYLRSSSKAGKTRNFFRTKIIVIMLSIVVFC